MLKTFVWSLSFVGCLSLFEYLQLVHNTQLTVQIHTFKPMLNWDKNSNKHKEGTRVQH